MGSVVKPLGVLAGKGLNKRAAGDDDRRPPLFTA